LFGDRTCNISIAAIALTLTFLHDSDNMLTDSEIKTENISALKLGHKKVVQKLNYQFNI